MEDSNLQKSLDNIRKLYEMLNECVVVSELGNYGKIIKRIMIIKYIDENGNLKQKQVNKFNILNRKGELICSSWFDIYRYDEHGNCIVGYEIMNPYYNKLPSDLLILGDKGKVLKQNLYLYGAINHLGNFKVSPIYEELYFGKEDTFIGGYSGRYGYINGIDGVHITPLVFEIAEEFSESLGCIRYKGEYGYVNRYNVINNPDSKMQYAIAPQYDKASSFKNGLAKVYKGSQVMKINKFNIEQSEKSYYKSKYYTKK